jgi:hypothetical protein
MTILKLSIAFAGENDTFTIRDVGTLFNIGNAEVTVSGT